MGRPAIRHPWAFSGVQRFSGRGSAAEELHRSGVTQPGRGPSPVAGQRNPTSPRLWTSAVLCLVSTPCTPCSPCRAVPCRADRWRRNVASARQQGLPRRWGLLIGAWEVSKGAAGTVDAGNDTVLDGQGFREMDRGPGTVFCGRQCPRHWPLHRQLPRSHCLFPLDSAPRAALRSKLSLPASLRQTTTRDCFVHRHFFSEPTASLAVVMCSALHVIHE